MRPAERMWPASCLVFPDDWSQSNRLYPITMDQQAGDILRRRRYQNLLTAPVPLGNGIVDPPAQQLTALDIDARIDWFDRANLLAA